MESFGGTREAAKARIAARTSRWNKTVYDPHVNILRATTEAMAAVLGGADAVTVAPFDACYKQPDEASRRLARNTQLLLKHEAWLGRVADAGGGSYALETITDFSGAGGLEGDAGDRGARRIPQGAGGGMIAQALERSHGGARAGGCVAASACWWERISMRIRRERALDRIDEQRMKADLRGARIYEELRLRTERHAAAGGKTPRVLLAEIGDVKMRAARSNFASEFLCLRGIRDRHATVQRRPRRLRRRMRT